MCCLLAIGYSIKGNPAEVVLGSADWNENKVVNIFDATLYRMSNAHLTQNLRVVGLTGDIDGYTQYDAMTRRIKKIAITILAEDLEEENYFISDGLSDPFWIKKKELLSYIRTTGYGLTNSRIRNNMVEPIFRQFSKVDKNGNRDSKR